MSQGHAPVGLTDYETWVRTLRAWALDPMTPLDALPPLADDTFSPATYARLVEHLTAALRAAADRWEEALSRAMGHVGVPFELERALVALRQTLAHRVRLSTHPSLPPGLREVLTKDVTEAVERLQAELEDAVRRQTAGASVDHAWRDQVMRAVRDNSLVRVLDWTPAADGSRLEAGPLPAHDPEAVGPRPTTRRGARRVAVHPPNGDPSVG